MAQSLAPAKAQSLSKPGSITGIMALLFISLIALLAIYQTSPPGAVSTSAPPSVFSSGRAMEHVWTIARKPHPVGSPEHAEVQGYIVRKLAEAGLDPSVQQATAVNLSGMPLYAGTVGNITARLAGVDSGKAILLVAHYDSVPTGPGAADNGSSVAALLETARALKEGGPLKNDVIFLFTDGEEAGLLGAKAFVEKHPWAKDVGLALNFEARGINGPSVMFETSNKNGWLIGELAAAHPSAITSSLFYEIYRILPNDTDLTVFKNGGMSGMNFAYINGLTHYHTHLDNPARIDERSLQHQGSYALNLARHFASQSAIDTRARNAVYFNVLGLTLVNYSEAWVAPLSGLAIILFIAVVTLGVVKKRLTLSGIASGALVFLLSVVCAVIIVTGAGWIIGALQGGETAQSQTYNSHLYLISFFALTIAASSALFAWFSRKISVNDLAVGASSFWLVLVIASWLFLPGGSYLFIWPLVFSLVGLGATFFLKDQAATSLKRLISVSICAVPLIVLLAPVVYIISAALTPDLFVAPVVLVGLGLGLLIPHVTLLTATNRLLLPLASALVGLCFLVGGMLTTGFDADRPRQNNLFYAFNADTGKSIWASNDPSPDQWTSQFLSSGDERGALADFFPYSSREFIKSEAPMTQLDAPEVALIEDKTNEKMRTLRLRITSQRGAPVASVYLGSEAAFLGAAINEERINPGPSGFWGFFYRGLPKQGLELTLESRPGSQVSVRVVLQNYGLPEIPGSSFKARPDDMIPSPFAYSDSTLVTRTFTF